MKNETALGESEVMIYCKVNKMQSAENFFQFFKLSLLHQTMYQEIHLLRLKLIALNKVSFCIAVSTMESSAEDGNANEIDF